MSRRKTTAVRPLSILPAGFNDDVELVARAVVTEAERALDGALAVLRHAGVMVRGTPTLTVPETFVLKLAACLRIYEWEQANLLSRLPPGLPSSAEVWADLLDAGQTRRERFPARELARQVFSAWFWHMSWTTPPLAPRCDVVVRGVRGGEHLVDELAELLVKFRHLVEQRRPERPEEE